MRSIRPSNRCRSNGIKGKKFRCKNRSIRKKIRRRNNMTIMMINVRSNLIRMKQIWNSSGGTTTLTEDKGGENSTKTKGT